MADKEKKVTQNSEVEKATTEESKAAEKVAKAAKGSKSSKPNFFARAGKGINRFFKDFRGESKKIVWPDAKTVLKNTGVVLVVVAIVTAVVFLIDYSLGLGISELKQVALDNNANAVVATNTDAESDKTSEEEKESEDKDEGTDEAEGDKADTQEDDKADESAE